MTTNLSPVRAQQIIDGSFVDIIICKEDNPQVLRYTKSLNLLTHQVSVTNPRLKFGGLQTPRR